MRKIIVALMTGLSLAIPGAAWAASGASGESVVLAKGDNRTGTYFVSGSTITINGNVDGDVVCAGQTVTVNGSVSGDVLCAGQTVTVNGPVTGSVRAVGQIVTVNGTVGRNVMAGAQSLVLGTNARVNGELTVGAQSVAMNGPVNQDVLMRTNSFELGATIGGSLNYSSDQALAIDRSKVKGGVTRHVSSPQNTQEDTAADKLGSLAFWTASGLLIMLAAVWVAPKLVRSVTEMMIRRPGASMGWGALALIVGPVVLMVLAITVIGLPLTFLAGALWLMSVLTGGLFAGVAVARMALGRKEASQRHLVLAALAGVPLIVIVSSLPWVGFLVGLVATAWTIGGLALSVNKARSLG